jgi:predicted alpha/beta hydrolase
MWRVIGPLMTRYKGYLAWSKLGMGEDLPLGVYRQTVPVPVALR